MVAETVLLVLVEVWVVRVTVENVLDSVVNVDCVALTEVVVADDTVLDTLVIVIVCEDCVVAVVTVFEVKVCVSVVCVMGEPVKLEVPEVIEDTVAVDKVDDVFVLVSVNVEVCVSVFVTLVSVCVEVGVEVLLTLVSVNVVV